MRHTRERLRDRAARLRSDTHALLLAYRDPRVGWPARIVVALVVAYALSPLDLIPDFVPVLGYVDDLLLVPLGVALAVRLIPPDVLAEHRRAASQAAHAARRSSRLGLALVLGIWAAAATWLVMVTMRMMHA